MLEVLAWNLWIVLCPNVGTTQYLLQWKRQFRGAYQNGAPVIKLLQQVAISGMENPHQVREDGLPYTEFKLMQDIDHEHLVVVKFEIAELVSECILKNIFQKGKWRVVREHTHVGTRDFSPKIPSMASPPTAYPNS